MQSLLDIFLDSERRLRTVWRFVIYGIGFFVVTVIVQIVAAIGLVGYFIVARPTGSDGDFGQKLIEWIVSLQNEHTWVLMALLTPPTALGLFGLTVLCRVFLDRRSISSMGYQWSKWGPATSLAGGLLWGLVPILAAIAIPWALGMYELEQVSLPLTLLIMPPTLIMAAYHEEFVFRGYLLQNMLDVRRPVIGVIVNSLLFWLVHSLNPAAWSSPLVGVNLFGAGVVLSLAYLASGNIWFPTSLHFAWNFAQGLLLSVPISGIKVEGIFNLRITDWQPAWIARLFTGGNFGLEASIITTLVELMLIGLLLLTMKSRQETPVEAILADENEPVEWVVGSNISTQAPDNIC